MKYLKYFLFPPVLLAIGTLLISGGLWFIYRPSAPIYIGIIFSVVAVGLATASEVKK